MPERSGEILGKIEAIGFGFLVPFFYVVTGIDFDLAALLDGGRPLLLLPVFLLLFLLVRGVPAYLLAPRDLTGRASRSALALFSSTCLPLVVAITAIGLDEKVIGAGRPPRWSPPRWCRCSRSRCWRSGCCGRRRAARGRGRRAGRRRAGRRGEGRVW